MKNKKLLTLVIVAVLFLGSAVASYAYFTATLRNVNGPNNIITQLGTLTLRFTDNDNNISILNAKPGDYIEKDFIVSNTGSLDTNYNIGWQKLNNEILRGELVVELECVSYSNFTSIGSGSNVVEGTCPDGTYIIGTSKESPITTMNSINAGYTHVYHATFRFVETNENQDYNQGKNFSGVLVILSGSELTDIEGLLSDSLGNEIANATIQTHSSPLTTHTDDQGYFLLEGIEYGNHEIEVFDSSNNLIATDTFELKKTVGTSTVINLKEVYYNSKEIDSRKMVTYIGNSNNIKEIEFSEYIKTPESCFEVGDDDFKIIGYYEHQGNDVNQPLCPKTAVVPTTLNGINITSLGEYAFTTTEINKLIIQNNITEIPENFATCYRSFLTTLPLKNLILGDNITKIGRYAFKGCSIEELRLPSSITNIEDEAFAECSIKELSLPSNITKIGNFAFSNNKITELDYNINLETGGVSIFATNEIRTLNIGNNVTNLFDYMFAENNLTTVTIPSSVSNLGAKVFYLNYLSNVNIKTKTDYNQFNIEEGWEELFGWDDNVTCVRDNISNVTNGCITWGVQ